MPKKKALLAGATGLVGRSLLKILLDDSYYQQIIVITRKPLGIVNERVLEYNIDFNNLELAIKDISVDDVYCCLGTTMKDAGSRANFKLVDYQYPVELALSTYKNNARQYLLVSAIGANSNSRFYYNRVKGDTEKGINDIGFEGFQIFRPSLLLGKRNKPRFGELIGKWMSIVFSFAFFGPFKRYKAIEANHVAMGMYKTGQRFPKGNNIYRSDQIRSL